VLTTDNNEGRVGASKRSPPRDEEQQSRQGSVDEYTDVSSRTGIQGVGRR